MTFNQMREKLGMDGHRMAVTGAILSVLFLFVALSVPPVTPALAQAKESAEVADCRQAGILLFAYANTRAIPLNYL
ncbi:MAG: hypothetical protein PHD76_11640 [Methylacidiphilales bacterium]|nr:hypothetical protein [Candidatus Methylacidiphilales bacterium]